MSRILRPDDLSRILADLDRRIGILENHGPGGIPLPVLVNGGTQPAGPLAGVNGPPFGLGLGGGEVALCTGTFSLLMALPVIIIAICTDYVQVASGPFSAAAPVYLQIDGTDIASAFAEIPVFGSNPLDPETRAQSATILYATTLAGGSHTVRIVWNSQEGTSDSCSNTNNALFVFGNGAP